MPTYIRLTDYKSSEEKERGFFKSENRYEAKQEDFEKIPGSPIAYWVSDRVKEIFCNGQSLEQISEPKQGMASGDNNRFIRIWFEVEYSEIGFNYSNIQEAHNSFLKWFPFNKGGEFRKWAGNNEYVIIFDKNTFDILANMGNNLPSRQYYFRRGITWSAISSGKFSVREQLEGTIFSNAGMSVFPSNDKFNYIVSFMNSNTLQKLLETISQTINFNAGDIKKMPIILPKSPETKQKIDELTQECIDISKEEWNSRETSWDFKASPLLIENGELRIENGKIEDAYNRYCEYWREKFFKLHENEEELNRLFIEIYELEDELTPDVPLEDITILKNETKIVNGKLEFRADEIMKQFISYGVGVMFGRYSLDNQGLLIANMDQELPTDTTFKIDDDNVIPVLEDDYFSDDIASRFIEFIKVTFGEEYLAENIRFIENSLGTTLRKYFVKGFYEDHIKRYKKRPIYWMVASPKKGFMSLIYMHRYQSDIFATVQNSYLYEYITKLEVSRENYQREADDNLNSNVQRSRATKQVEKIGKILEEVIKFDREVFTKYAQDSIEIDLDDGVKVNYCKFKDILYTIKGLCK